MAAVRSVNAGNYVAAARAASNNFVQTYGAVLDNSPNYREIARTGLVENAKTKIEAMKADAQVAEAGIKKERDLRIAKYKLDSANSIFKAQESQRKAGKLAAASENLYEAFKKQREPFKPDFEGQQKYIDDDKKKIETKTVEVNSPDWRSPGMIDPTNQPVPELVPWDYETGTPIPSSNGSSTSLQNSSPSSAFIKTSTSQPLSLSGFRGEVYDYLTGYHQLNPNQALGIMANIDRESSFRINPPGGDGGNSFGLLQWNNALGRSQRMKLNVPDWETNWKGQLDHALSQNQESIYNEFVGRYKNTDYPTPEAASEAFLREWEKPEKAELDIKKNNQFLQGYRQGGFI
tara:strand:- start:103 stop:1143 length:1041 start_codon:yes stop_codon:yes gene_type:complete